MQQWAREQAQQRRHEELLEALAELMQHCAVGWGQGALTREQERYVPHPAALRRASERAPNSPLALDHRPRTIALTRTTGASA